MNDHKPNPETPAVKPSPSSPSTSLAGDSASNQEAHSPLSPRTRLAVRLLKDGTFARHLEELEELAQQAAGPLALLSARLSEPLSASASTQSQSLEQPGTEDSGDEFLALALSEFYPPDDELELYGEVDPLNQGSGTSAGKPYPQNNLQQALETLVEEAREHLKPLNQNQSGAIRSEAGLGSESVEALRQLSERDPLILVGLALLLKATLNQTKPDDSH